VLNGRQATLTTQLSQLNTKCKLLLVIYFIKTYNKSTVDEREINRSRIVLQITQLSQTGRAQHK